MRAIKPHVSEVVVLIGMLSLLWVTDIQKIGNVIPNSRIVFFPFLDPEFVVYPLALFTIAYYAQKRYRLSASFLFLTTIFHPLYSSLIAAILLCHQLITNRLRFKLFASYTALALLPYTLFVWWVSRAREDSIFEASKIGEYVRAPHHSVIPTVEEIGGGTMRFYAFTGVVLILSSLLIAFIKSAKVRVGALNVLSIPWIILLTLYSVTLLATFKRIPLLVELTPYRIGSFAVVIGWLLLVVVFFSIWQSKQKISRYLIVLAAALLLLGYYDVSPLRQAVIPAQTELSTWITSNTDEDSLFLNYTSFDVRTQGMRSDYFTFKNYPLITEAQIHWYQQAYIYHDLESEGVDILDYRTVKEKMSATRVIDVNNVLSEIEEPVDYVLTNTDDPNIRILDLDPLFVNANYTVWQVRREDPVLIH